MRPKFYGERIDGKLVEAEKKDRFDVSHAAIGEVRICRDCGVLVRVEDDAPDFESEPYADYVMERMLNAHIDAFRKKAPRYRSLLPEGANVVEVASYVGGFLHVAGEWGWNAIGVDVGRDTSHFTKSRGYRTRDESLADCRFDDAAFDAVFIWNAFEQLDPHPLLDEARRIVRDGGLLLVRIPNALFYAACQPLLRRPLDPHDPILIALGHGNLLGFPHLYGYAAASLDRLIAPHRFERIAIHSDRHITPLRGRLTVTAIHETERLEATQRALDDAFQALAPDAIIGPWMEAVYRSTTSPK